MSRQLEPGRAPRDPRVSTAITHVAMAVAPGTLSPTYREAVLEFYGSVFGWTELEQLRRTDRLTIAVASGAYVNLREHPSATLHEYEYEHFGLRLASTHAVFSARDEVVRRGVAASPIEEPLAGEPMFHFAHLLPMRVEVQSPGLVDAVDTHRRDDP